MGYSLNQQIVQRRRHLLVNLERGIEASWVITGDLKETRDFAYELREALWIAAQFPEDFPELAKAHKEWRIEIVRAGHVRAVPKKKRGYAETNVSDVGPGKPMSLKNPHTADEVVAAWRMHLPSSDALNFTEVDLNLDQMTKLYEFAVSHAPKLMILYDEEAKLLTLSHHDIGMREFAWTPPREPAQVEDFEHL
jgi:hypothetical protein